MSDDVKRDVLVQAFMDELLDEIPFSLKRELAEKMADNIPKVDAVEVVRCKGCKYRQPVENCMFGECMYAASMVADDDYCSNGERKGADDV